MKYFLDSAKLDEIQTAYNTFGIDGVTTNPRHIMLSGKPFLTAIQGIADWIKSEGLDGYERFPVSVEINPHLDEAEAMLAEARKIAAISPNFVIKIPATEAGVTAARKLEAEGIRTNVTLVFSPAQAILPAKNHSLFVSPFIGWKEANGEDCKAYIRNIVDIYKNYGFYGKTQIICAATHCSEPGAKRVTPSSGRISAASPSSKSHANCSFVLMIVYPSGRTPPETATQKGNEGIGPG